MGLVKVSDEQVRQAAERIASGELQRDVARSVGITGRGLRLRLAALGLSGGKRGRRPSVRLNHCRTCRCKEPRS